MTLNTRSLMNLVLLFFLGQKMEIFYGVNIVFQVISFFGYIGTRVGFPGWLTHAGAGFAEAVDPAHEKIRNICDRAYLPPERIPTLGDDPADFRAVEFGIQLWKKYDSSLSLSQFRRELQQNYHKFTPPPALPGNGGIPAYPWRKNVLGGWPYNIGHFNGSRQYEHWPPRLENGFGFYEP